MATASKPTPSPAASARGRAGVPRILVYGALMLVCLAFVPPAIVARVRAVPSPNRRIALIQDMDNQPRFGAQQPNPVFADNRSMRPPVPGALARQDPEVLDVAVQGAVGGAWSETLPPGMVLDMTLLLRGQGRFNIYCSVCHGYAGFGDGIVNQRAMALMSNVNGPVNGTTWVQAKSLHDPTVEPQPIGQIFHTITYGIRNMAGYGAQIPAADRWAIAAYVKTLQKSQNASGAVAPAPAAAAAATPAGR